MPSSNKTGFMSLNRWIGSDKPKKDDFNSDNAVIDNICRQLSTRIDEAEGHAVNGSVHVTAAEKAAWSAPGDSMVIGSYTGNGDYVQDISMGFRPKAGFLFAVGVVSVYTDFYTQDCKVYSGFFSEQGCSRNISITETGIKVNHHVTKPPDGCSTKYNDNGTTYIYIAWPE